MVYDTDPAPIYANRCSIAAGPVCLIPASRTRPGGFWAAREYPFSHCLVVDLTWIPTFATLSPCTMQSLRQPGSGMISARVGRG